MCLDNIVTTEKELDTVEVLKAIQKAKEVKYKLSNSDKKVSLVLRGVECAALWHCKLIRRLLQIRSKWNSFIFPPAFEFLYFGHAFMWLWTFNIVSFLFTCSSQCNFNNYQIYHLSQNITFCAGLGERNGRKRQDDLMVCTENTQLTISCITSYTSREIAGV